MSRRGWQLVWWGWLGVILLATTVYSNIFVGHSHWFLVQWIPFQSKETIGEFSLDLLQNILLFFPLGYAQHPAGLAGTTRRLLAIGLTGLVLSLGVELFQVYSHGRAPATTDIIMNVTGALLGGYRQLRNEIYFQPTTS